MSNPLLLKNSTQTASPDNTVQPSSTPSLDYTTFGQNWTQTPAISANWSAISSSANGQYVSACINPGAIYVSNNYGATWMAITTSNGVSNNSLAWTGIALSASGQYQIATVNTGLIYRSINFGVTWTSTASSLAWSAVAISSSGAYVTAVVNGGQIWYSTDYGVTWTAILVANGVSSITLNWSAIAVSSTGATQVATLNTGAIYYSLNTGQSWTTSNASSSAWTAVAMSASGQYVTATITGGGIYYSSDYGKTWTASTSSGTTVATWAATAVSSTGQYQIAAGASIIYYSSNYGVSWTSAGTSYNIKCATISATGQYVMVAINGGLMYCSVTRNPTVVTSNVNTSLTSYNDGSVQISATPNLDYTTFGQNWTQVTGGIATASWGDVAMSSNGQYQTVTCNTGSTNYINYSQNYGQTWSPATITTGYGYTRVAMSYSGQYQVTGVNVNAPGGIYVSSNYGQTWAIVASSPTGTWNGFCVSGSGQYMSGNIYNGSIYYSNNYGVSFTIAPTTSAIYWQKMTSSASGQYQYAGYNGGVYVSNTYGQTWTQITGGPFSGTCGTIACSASGQYVITACANIYYSTNYGQTWSTASGTTFSWNSVSCSSSGQYAIASNNASSNGIYYSTNYGVTWSQITVSYNNVVAVSISATGQYALATSGTVLYLSTTRSPGLFTSGSIILGNSASNNQPQISYTQVGVGSTTNYGTIGFNGANTLCWTAGGSVGIGTTAPAYKLDVSGTLNASGNLSTAGNIAVGATGVAGSPSSIRASPGFPLSGAATQIYVSDSANSSYMSLLLGSYYTSNTTSYGSVQASLSGVGPMSLALNPAGGNVGIGTSAPQYTLDLTGTANLGNALSTVYNSMGYTAASLAAISLGNGGVSGPVGGVYTFTYNGAGNDFIIYNMLPPNSMIQVSITASSPNGITFQIGPDSVTAYYLSPPLTNTFITYTFTTKTTSSGTLFMHVSNGTSGYMLKWNAFSVNRLDTSLTGNVGIGITNPVYTLDVNGHIGIPTNKFIHFTRYRTNGDAFCIGMAGGNEVFRFVGADDAGNNRISYFGYYTGDSTANTWNAQLQINHQTGAAYNKANTWGNSSDINIKENIEDTRSYLEDICKLRVVKYSLKEDKLKAPNMIGVIAQEVEQIFPNLVDTINNIKCVKHSVINVILLKAFQEQNKIVQQQAIQLASQASEIATLKEQMATVLAKFA